jgi:SnoaL-like polyketide cyclase
MRNKKSLLQTIRLFLFLTVSGKHVGNFFGIQPTGRSFSYQAVQIHSIDDGKIVEHKAIRDDLRFMLQLGLFTLPHLGNMNLSSKLGRVMKIEELEIMGIESKGRFRSQKFVYSDRHLFFSYFCSSIAINVTMFLICSIPLIFKLITSLTLSTLSAVIFAIIS